MTEEETFRLLSQMLMYGTQMEKDYATRKLDEWFVEDQKKNLPLCAEEVTDVNQRDLTNL